MIGIGWEGRKEGGQERGSEGGWVGASEGARERGSEGGGEGAREGAKERGTRERGSEGGNKRVHSPSITATLKIFELDIFARSKYSDASAFSGSLFSGSRVIIATIAFTSPPEQNARSLVLRKIAVPISSEPSHCIHSLRIAEVISKSAAFRADGRLREMMPSL